MPEDKIDKLTKTVDNLAVSVDTLTKTVDNLEETVGGLTKTVNNVATMLVHVKDKVDNEMATTQGMADMESRLLNHIDGFVKLH